LRKHFKKLFEHKSEEISLAIDELKEFIGQKAIVTEKITPNKNGRVEFRGSYWTAESDETIIKGKPVEIIAKKNITLIVKSL
jgi:membrane protein implicated in regulation of membrane protease activity